MVTEDTDPWLSTRSSILPPRMLAEEGIDLTVKCQRLSQESPNLSLRSGSSERGPPWWVLFGSPYLGRSRGRPSISSRGTTRPSDRTDTLPSPVNLWAQWQSEWPLAARPTQCVPQASELCWKAETLHVWECSPPEIGTASGYT